MIIKNGPASFFVINLAGDIHSIGAQLDQFTVSTPITEPSVPNFSDCRVPELPHLMLHGAFFVKSRLISVGIVLR